MTEIGSEVEGLVATQAFAQRGWLVLYTLHLVCLYFPYEKTQLR